MNLTEKLRAGHVRRWHIVAVAREQTIAEHMHRVGVIAEEILRILGLFDWNSSLTLNTMRWAAIHDRHEFKLGDLPTPAKDLIRSFVGTEPFGDPIDAAAAVLDPEAEELRQCVAATGECPLAGYIVKYADTLEAMNYVGIFGCGSHAAGVHHGLRNSANKAYNNLINHYDPGFDAASELHALIDQLAERR